MTKPILNHFPQLKQLALDALPEIGNIIKYIMDLKRELIYEPECREDLLESIEGSDKLINKYIDNNIIPHECFYELCQTQSLMIEILRETADKIEACKGFENFLRVYGPLEKACATAYKTGRVKFVEG